MCRFIDSRDSIGVLDFRGKKLVASSTDYYSPSLPHYFFSARDTEERMENL